MKILFVGVLACKQCFIFSRYIGYVIPDIDTFFISNVIYIGSKYPKNI